MSTLIRIPVDLRSPEQTGLAGNSFWTVNSGTVSQMGYWAFLGNTSGGSGTGIRATGGIVYGYVQVPSNADPNSVPSLIVSLGASATAASVAFFRVGTKEIQTGMSFDNPSWVHENGVAWTAPTTAYARQDLSFTLTSATTADAILAIKIERNIVGSGSGIDVSTATIGCFDVYLQITATA